MYIYKVPFGLTIERPFRMVSSCFFLTKRLKFLLLDLYLSMALFFVAAIVLTAKFLPELIAYCKMFYFLGGFSYFY